MLNICMVIIKTLNWKVILDCKQESKGVSYSDLEHCIFKINSLLFGVSHWPLCAFLQNAIGF
jgi:hypothetical protein